MYRYCAACLVFAFLGGCAANPPAPAAPVATSLSFEPAAAENAAVAPANGQAQLTQAVAGTLIGVTGSPDTVCETTTQPGSRIVVGKRCYSSSERAANTRLQIEEMRRDQEMRERAERDREMQRQRAAMQTAFP